MEKFNDQINIIDCARVNDKMFEISTSSVSSYVAKINNISVDECFTILPFFNFLNHNKLEEGIRETLRLYIQEHQETTTTNIALISFKRFCANFMVGVKRLYDEGILNYSDILFEGRFPEHVRYIIKFLKNIDYNIYHTDKKIYSSNIYNELLSSDHFFTDIKESSIIKSKSYSENNKHIIPHYFHALLGVEKTEDLGAMYDYINKFVDIKTNIENINIDVQYNTLSNNTIYLSKITELIKSDSLLEDLENVLLFDNPEIEGYAKKILNLFLPRYLDFLKAKNLKNVENYINSIFVFVRQNIKLFNMIKTEQPTILFYGKLNSLSLGYILLLGMYGINVFYVSFNKDAKELLSFQDFIQITELTDMFNMNSIPDTRLINNKTNAKIASDEVSAIFTDKSLGIYKPMQLNNLTLRNVTLDTTYDEIYIIGQDEIRFRFGFDFNNQEIYVPNLFCKVYGVHDDVEKFKNEVEKITSLDNVFCKKILTNDDVLFDVGNNVTKQYLDNKGELKTDVLNNPKFNFSHLKVSIQTLIVSKINHIINADNIFIGKIDKDKFVNIVLNLLSPNMTMFHVWDYAKNNPKLVIYAERFLTNEESLQLSYVSIFFNQMGADVIIYSIAGYNDIERFLSPEVYKTHQLSNLKESLLHKGKPNFFQKIFQK